MKRSPTATALVRRLYVESVDELLAAYGLSNRVREAGADPAAARRMSYVSVLGLTADGLRICSILDLDVELLASLHPARVGAPDALLEATDLGDWCRELNNQLGGRLKNKLVVRGCDPMLGLPSLLTGMDISAIAQGDMDMYQAVYVADGRRMVVTLATQICADMTLTEEASQNTGEILAEGAIALF